MNDALLDSFSFLLAYLDLLDEESKSDDLEDSKAETRRT